MNLITCMNGVSGAQRNIHGTRVKITTSGPSKVFSPAFSSIWIFAHGNLLISRSRVISAEDWLISKVYNRNVSNVFIHNLKLFSFIFCLVAKTGGDIAKNEPSDF